MQQCLLGMQCQDFTMIAADQTNSMSIIVMKTDEDKIYPIADRLMLGVNGDNGDVCQFTQFVAKNIKLYKMRNGYPLGATAAVHFTRKNLSDSLRNGTPIMVNALMGGYDEDSGGQLYYMDFLATCVKERFAAHGFGGLLCIGILGSYYRPTLTETEAYEVMKLCVREIQQRLFINLASFEVKVVNKSGIFTLPPISVASLMTVG